MKKNQIIIFFLTIGITGILYFIVLSNKKEEIKEKKGVETSKYISVAPVKNEKRALTISSYGQITAFTEIDVAFEIQGRLQQGETVLKPGSRFKRNQLLYKVGSEEMFYSLNARKAQLSNLVISILPDISIDYADTYQKWNEFLNAIKPSSFLPNLPSFDTEKEKMFITSKGIYGEYWNIKSLEEKISKYIYLAPFDGSVTAVYTEPGSIVNPGGRISRISNIENMEVKLPIPIDALDKFKAKGAVTFFNAKGNKIGDGKLLRLASELNMNTQSIDAYYSIKPISKETLLAGQYVTASINNLISESVAVIPSSAVKQNKVYVIENFQLIPKDIRILSQKQDSLFVEGLSNQDTLIVQYRLPSKDIKKYIGITQEK